MLSKQQLSKACFGRMSARPIGWLTHAAEAATVQGMLWDERWAELLNLPPSTEAPHPTTH